MRLLGAGRSRAARRDLPFGLGRQALAGPFCVGIGIRPRNHYHRMLHRLLNGAIRPERMPPVRAFDIRPVFLAAAVKPAAAFAFCRGRVFGGCDKRRELAVGDFVPVDVKRIETHAAHRRILLR